MRGAYYNEHDPNAAQWLRNLIARGHIAPGDVDERSIVDVRPDDLRGYAQCHFFAGVGVWSYAFRRAGWPDDRPVWSGSAPCQPFSDAGKGNEFADERHLWPAWFGLIRELHPDVVFGEQVSSKDALAWLDHVCADLEGAGYAVGALDTCAAGVGAPHIRQRLYLVAESERGAAERHGRALGGTARGMQGEGLQRQRLRLDVEHGGDARAVADDDEGGRCVERAPRLHDHRQPRHDADGRRALGVVVDTVGARPQGLERSGDVELQRGAEPLRPAAKAGAVNGFWRNAIWIPCRDGKARAIEPGIEPLVDGATARVVRLRAYGNAINAEQAAEFIGAYLEV